MLYFLTFRLFRICTMVIFDDMPVTVITVIIGTKRFVGDCEILNEVGDNEKYIQTSLPNFQ